MDIEILFNQIRTNSDQGGLFDLFEQFILYGINIPVYDFEVQDYEEMRIDLVMQRMYNLEPQEIGLYLKHIDVILSINNIDNPLNIKKGMILKYPSLGTLDEFRYVEDQNSRTKTKTPILAVPNVSTRKDKARENYKKNDFSLPPVALATPRPSIRREGGIVKVGGL